MTIEIIFVGKRKYFNIENNLFNKHSDGKKNKKVTYWRCQVCDARATTELSDGNEPELKIGIFLSLNFLQLS